MDLKIARVDLVTLDIPFVDRPARHMARQLWRWSVVEVCKVTTDTGIIGYGETIVHYTWGRVGQEQIERVMGQDPCQFLWDDSLGAGLQMAIYDAVGKALGLPCYRLLGKKGRDWCPISWWAIDMPAEDWAKEAKEAVGRGYTSLKLKARPWFDIVDQVMAVREVVPEQFKLDVDFNSMLLNASNAVPLLLELERIPNVAIFETPIPQDDIEGNQRLRARITRPLAMHYGDPPVLAALREGVCDGFVIGGGAAQVMRQGTVAAEANKPFWLQMVGTGITTAFMLHLGAVLSHAQWPAVTCHHMYSDDLLTQPLEIQAGYAHVPEAPGLSIEVDEGALERLRVEPPVEKPEPRKLFYITWPDGRRVYYAHCQDYHRDFYAGNQPIFQRGAKLVTLDDGSQEFARLRQRAEEAPFVATA